VHDQAGVRLGHRPEHLKEQAAPRQFGSMLRLLHRQAGGVSRGVSIRPTLLIDGLGSGSRKATHSGPSTWESRTEGADGFPRSVNNQGQAVGFAEAGELSAVAIMWTIPVRAALDILPGSAGNSIKLGGGSSTVAVAILGSRWFRAADVTPASLTLGDDDGLDTPVARKKSAPLARLTDVNRDGFPDLVAEFDKRQLRNNGDLAAGAQTLFLLGRMQSGTHLRGADVVAVAP
jgi:hypothetical protein